MVRAEHFLFLASITLANNYCTLLVLLYIMSRLPYVLSPLLYVLSPLPHVLSLALSLHVTGSFINIS